MQDVDQQTVSNVWHAAIDYMVRLRHQNPPRQFRHRAQRQRWKRERERAWREGVIPFRPREMFGRAMTPAERRALAGALEFLSLSRLEVIRGRKRVTHLRLRGVVLREDVPA